MLIRVALPCERSPVSNRRRHSEIKTIPVDLSGIYARCLGIIAYIMRMLLGVATNNRRIELI